MEKSDKLYRILVKTNETTILTYLCNEYSQDDFFIMFLDIKGKSCVYNKANVISIEEVKKDGDRFN